MQAYRKDFPVPEFNGQFDRFGWLTADKLTDPTEGAPVPEPVEGALPKQYIYTVAHASGSEKQCSSFRVSASVFSVKFRVLPWLYSFFLQLNPKS
jgi:protein involved in ribonucleotide reduction